MRKMEENFNKDTCIETLRFLSGNQKLKEMPHYDTLNYYLERLSLAYPGICSGNHYALKDSAHR